MTDTAQPAIDQAALMTTYAAWEAAADRLVPGNKAKLFAFLASIPIMRVIVTFDGEGDSGQIEDIHAWDGDEQVPLPGGEIEMLELPYGETEPVVRRLGIALVLKTLAYHLLREKHEGWENSDGAYGDFTFDVTAGTITLDYNERFMSSENHVHSW